MPATLLATKRVEKPWGRHHLYPGFADPAPDGEPIGEIWFQSPHPEEPELLIKYLFTSDKLSIQVHPDDAKAQAVGYPRGKDEAWVVLDADPHACIGLGMLRPMTRDELRQSALDGSIEELIDWKAVKKDDSYYTPAGTVHAIGPGLTVVEVQQNVDLTYRLYDYGSARELHLKDGVAASNPVPYVAVFKPYEAEAGREILADGPKFVLERWQGARSSALAGDGRPLWLVPLSGKGTIDGDTLDAGSAWLVKDGAALQLEADSDMLVAYPKSGVIDRLAA